MERRKQLYSSVTFIIVTGGGFLYCLRSIEESNLSIHPMFLPAIVTGLMFGLSICRLIVAYMMPKDETAEKVKLNIPMKPVLTAAMIVAYAILFKRLGFVVSSAMYLFAQMSLMKSGKKNWMLIAGFSIISPMVVYMLFVNALDVMLPSGILWF